MSHYLELTPESQEYLRSVEIFQNLTYNTMDVTLDADMAEGTIAPKLLADGNGWIFGSGQILVDTASLSANMTLCTLPTKIVPQQDTYHPVVVLRAGAYVANAVKVDESSQEIILLTQPQQNDVVCLDSVQFLVDSINRQMCASKISGRQCNIYVASGCAISA